MFISSTVKRSIKFVLSGRYDAIGVDKRVFILYYVKNKRTQKGGKTDEKTGGSHASGRTV